MYSIQLLNFVDYTEVFVALYLVPRYWVDTSSLHLPLDNKDRYTVDTRCTSIHSRYKTKIDKTIQRRRTIDTVRGVLLISVALEGLGRRPLDGI